MQIRTVRQQDYTQWLYYWNAYLAFYQTELDEEITQLTWARFFDDEQPLFCAVAVEEEHVLGFVSYNFHRSTWAKEYYCYLEDLFVDEQRRGQHIGQQLIKHVRQQALSKNCSRLYWHTHRDNHIAQHLYDAVASQSAMLQYRMPL